MTGFSYRGGELFCEGARAEELATGYGTPLYVYSQNGILNSFDAVCRAFAEASPIVAFSVKSCSTLAVLELLRTRGAGFDIVSGGELIRALRAGADPRKIVFSGVGKTDAEIRMGLENDILMFNVESEAELDRIQILAAELDTVAPVAIRLNPDVDA
ncbi:MAG: diaminopimelate decarboxylase, partial [Planctomycetota bacterium]|nr:diaminopimelate decarboxylase [Planctomycetota bacterium]